MPAAGRARARDWIALTAGAGSVAGFAPLAFYPIVFAAAAALLWSWYGATPRRAAWRGFLFGMGFFGGGVSWVYISLHTYGGAALPFAIFANLLLILYLAAYPAATGYLAVRLAPAGPAAFCAVVAPGVWVLSEWVRSWLLTGFPWLSIGYTQIDGPLAGLSRYGGVFGLGWAVMVLGGLLALAAIGPRGRRLPWACAFGAASAAVALAPQVSWTRPAGAPIEVAVVQGNISQDRKWRPGELERTLATYTRLSREAQDADLVVWPETAIPVFRDQAAEFLRVVAEEARATDTDYLTGIPTGDWEEGVYHNSVIGIGRVPGVYHKHRLLPFGEYLPLRSLLAFAGDLVRIPMSDFTPGAPDQPLLAAAGHPAGVSICFEAAFGGEIRRSMPEARYLVNVSNDAWFGDSLAPHQHLEIARMRALELGRDMVRATNTGVSALIDHRGRVTGRTELFQPAVLRGEITPRGGATPYARLGDLPVVLGLLVLVGAGAIVGKRVRTEGR